MRTLLTTLGLGLTLLPLTAPAVASPAPSDAPTLTIAEAQADAQALYEGLQQAHADLFAATPKPVFDQYYARLQAQLSDGPIPHDAYIAHLQRFVAQARHGHARVENSYDGFRAYLDAKGQVFPLGFQVHDGAVVITKAPANSAVAPGDQILALNGAPNSDWLARLIRNISAETPALAYALLEDMEMFYIWREFGAAQTFTLDIQTPAGEQRTVQLAAVPYDDLSDRTGLDSLDLEGRQAAMLTRDIAYLRPGPFYNIEAETAVDAFAPEAIEAFTAFIDTAYSDFNTAGARALILDLRNNPGGTNSFSDPILAWIADEPFRFASEFRIRVSDQTTASNQARLDAHPDAPNGISARFAALFAQHEPGDIVLFDLPYAQPRTGERFDGAVYALINRKSYSNAASVGAIIQDYGLGVVMGEATTDMTTTYGAMETFTLPHSGLTIGYPKAHIIRPNGETQSHPLRPDIALPAYRLGDTGDTMLEAAITHIELTLN